MARDYDYLFKLLIIGDSGKARPGMSTGSGPVVGFFFVFVLFCFTWGKSAPYQSPISFLVSQNIDFSFLELKERSLKRPPPPYFCGADRAEVVCPGWAYQPFRPDISLRSVWFIPWIHPSFACRCSLAYNVLISAVKGRLFPKQPSGTSIFLSCGLWLSLVSNVS